MIFRTCYEAYKRIDWLARGEQFYQLLEELEQALDELPKEEVERNLSFLMAIKADFSYRVGFYDDALQVLTYMVFDRRMACADWIFGKFPSTYADRLKPLREMNDQLMEAERKQAKPEYKVYLPADYSPATPRPLFLALHQGGDNTEILSWYWKPQPFVDKGFVFAFVQSSDVCKHGHYQWLRDVARARRDIRTCFAGITGEYAIDPSQVYIGGYSCGGIMAIDTALADTIPIRGFIALCPYEKPESFSEATAKVAADRGVKGVIMEGEWTERVPAQDEMIDMFTRAGVPVRNVVNRGVAERAPDDLSEKLAEALEFLSLP
jgi:hypothetical protein